LSGQKVITDLFAESGGEANLESAIEHIAVAQRTDVAACRAATADVNREICARYCGRFFDHPAFGFDGSSSDCAAMNVNMWNHAATQENLEMLARVACMSCNRTKAISPVE